MNGKFLFDTNAIIYYLQGLPEWVASIDGAVMTARYASVVTRMELLAFPGITKDEESRIRRFLADLTVMPLNDVIENMAIEVRRTARLKLPDAIVVATAVSEGATLITGDKKLADFAWPGFQSKMPQ
jgi:predicted nucleic acid-binding protein